MPAERITNTTYSWGNDINASQANYGGGAETTNVGQYAPNPWGFMICTEMYLNGPQIGMAVIRTDQ